VGDGLVVSESGWYVGDSLVGLEWVGDGLAGLKSWWVSGRWLGWIGEWMV
jgi:hypothetical protein